ncbi:nuclear receptor 2C2-associated protein-like [Gigantopelta aegis]|uniref:nuclear receptor 2C2-associated protein-like n=1 Tax=Gigantopelta aegis TaxID=1735272 RepID=UPI001B88B5BD|nr:nuclear receptor 2C2-associated protein-like [Gigantopelta aegis]
MAASIISEHTKIRVSSVLNRDTKQFGKKHLLDHIEDTCWNSDQGSPQWIILDLGKTLHITEIHIQFQGGFAGKECWVEGSTSDSNFKKITSIYPEDINSKQIFRMPEDASPIECVKIVFNSSTDFYGRVTIYCVDVIGRPA